MVNLASRHAALGIILISPGAAILLLGFVMRLQMFVDGEPYVLAENQVAEAYPGGYFSLTLDVRGDTIRAYLDGELILSALDETYVEGKIGLMSYVNQGSHFDEVLVTSERKVYDPPERAIEHPVRTFRAPYIQRPARTGLEIAWRTPTPEVGRVVYGIRKGFLDREVVEAEPRTKHHVQLSGLLPSSRYFYEVYSGGQKIGGEDDFRTARRHDETRFSFLVLGDSGVDTDVQWAIAEKMRSNMYQREVDFITGQFTVIN